ncbi:MAG: DUF4339 domain-containing protein [Planctomycetaceae bacterium]|nr:DUF4339 domain-containing protein [Planctomycetaceae bacterium]
MMSREPPTPQSPASSAADEHRWYYLAGCRLCGPVSTEQLLRDAVAGRVVSETQVRLGTHGEWITASSLDGLLPSHDTLAESGRPSEVATSPRQRSDMSRVVAECRAYLLQQDLRRAQDSTRPAVSQPDRTPQVFVEIASRFLRVIGAAANVVIGITSAVFAAIIAPLPRVETVLRIVRSRVVWSVVICGVSIAVGLLIYNTMTRQRRQAESIDAIALQFRELRQREAADNEWQDFADQARKRLEMLIAELEQAARADDRTSMDLLWAARDFLPRMLIDAREGPTEAERQFEVCMRRVRRRHAVKTDM